MRYVLDSLEIDNTKRGCGCIVLVSGIIIPTNLFLLHAAYLAHQKYSNLANIKIASLQSNIIELWPMGIPTRSIVTSSSPQILIPFEHTIIVILL
jgi:hypothetical protein